MSKCAVDYRICFWFGFCKTLFFLSEMSRIKQQKHRVIPYEILFKKKWIAYSEAQTPYINCQWWLGAKMEEKNCHYSFYS